MTHTHAIKSYQVGEILVADLFDLEETTASANILYIMLF